MEIHWASKNQKRFPLCKSTEDGSPSAASSRLLASARRRRSAWASLCSGCCWEVWPCRRRRGPVSGSPVPGLHAVVITGEVLEHFTALGSSFFPNWRLWIWSLPRLWGGLGQLSGLQKEGSSGFRGSWGYHLGLFVWSGSVFIMRIGAAKNGQFDPRGVKDRIPGQKARLLPSWFLVFKIIFQVGPHFSSLFCTL